MNEQPDSVDAPGRHPGIEQWIAYHAGELADDDQTSLQDHLAACRECTDLVLDLGAFQGDATTRQASEFERVAAWRALRPSLADAESAGPDLAVPTPSNDERARWLGRYQPLTLAASFLIAALGLGLWTSERGQVAELRAQLDELGRPQPNALLYDLDPGAVKRSEDRAAQTIELPEGTNAFTLILSSREPRELPSYRVTILDADERAVQTVDGLVADEMGVLTLGLTRHSLPAGDYLVRLDGVDGSSVVTLESYPLRVVYR